MRHWPRLEAQRRAQLQLRVAPLAALVAAAPAAARNDEAATSPRGRALDLPSRRRLRQRLPGVPLSRAALARDATRPSPPRALALVQQGRPLPVAALEGLAGYGAPVRACWSQAVRVSPASPEPHPGPLRWASVSSARHRAGS